MLCGSYLVNGQDGDLAESIKRSASNRLDDSLPNGSNQDFSTVFHGIGRLGGIV